MGDLLIEARTVPLDLPPVLLACAPEPAPPAGEPGRNYDDRAAMSWVVDLADAGEDCRRKVAAIAAIQAQALESRRATAR